MKAPAQGEGFCSPHDPWVVRLGGPPLGLGARTGTGIVFTPAHPCGATIDDLGPTGTFERLEVLARWGGCVGGRMVPLLDAAGCPVLDDNGVALQRLQIDDGELVVVRGTVQAHLGEHNPHVTPPFGPCDANVFSNAFEVKLAVRACGMPEPVIIDSDSELVVPAGPITIEVLAPAGWFVGRGPVDTVETDVLDVTLRVSACPCSCGYTPEGRLTSSWTQDENFDPFEMVRPRRARKLLAQAASAGGASEDTNITWRRRPGAAIMAVSQWSTNALPLSCDLVGAWPVLGVQIGGGGGVGHITLVWGIV